MIKKFLVQMLKEGQVVYRLVRAEDADKARAQAALKCDRVTNVLEL